MVTIDVQKSVIRFISEEALTVGPELQQCLAGV